MLIDDLIRLGRPLLDADFDPSAVLSLITDVADVRAKNFYRNVLVVVLPEKEGEEPEVLPLQQFGEEEDKDFRVDLPRAVGIPILLPSGGNPLNPQGRYGLPVYPIYDAHWKDFADSAEKARDFLDGRLERTPGLTLTETARAAVAAALHASVAGSPLAGATKALGVLVLVGGSDCYHVRSEGSTERTGLTRAGQTIVPNLPGILSGIWQAKVEEGREAGKSRGRCSFTGEEGDVVSPYCKAWPWAFPTWNCPLPHGGDEKMVIEGIALSAESYRALTLGACVFNRLAKNVSSLVLPEIFSPADDQAGKELAQRRKITDKIFGSGLLLPVLDSGLQDPNRREDYARGILSMLEKPPEDPAFEDRYLTAVTGFDLILPEEATDEFRLTLVYFSGDWTRGDVHLRAVIEEVLPSTVRAVRDLNDKQIKRSMALLRTLMPAMSEKQQAYRRKCYGSVPYLLARAYGGAYLWQQLQALLHRRPLDHRRVTANAARRMQSAAHRWPDSRYAVFEEVGFHLSYLEFLDRINRDLAGRTGEPSMRPWKELLEKVDKGPVSELELDDPAELGFACGALIRRFSRSYYMAQKKEGKRDADYLRDRVLTFGTDLRPEAVHDKGLRMILELPGRLRTLRRSRDLEERAGVAINVFQRLKERVMRDREDFLAAFWAGYALQGYDRPRKTKPQTAALAAE